MAYWDGGSGTRGGGRVPPSSDVRQIPSPSEQMTPDTEENVIDEAEDVIRNFIFESYQHQLTEEVDTLDSSTPQVPELCAFTSDPMRFVVVQGLREENDLERFCQENLALTEIVFFYHPIETFSSKMF